MPLDLNEIKETIRDTLRTWIYPQQLNGKIEIALSDSIRNYEIAESFYPFSQCYTSKEPYRFTLPVSIKVKKYGSPDNDLIINLMSNKDNSPYSILSSSTIPSSSISTSLEVITTNFIRTRMIGSNTKYWLKVTPTNSPSNTDYYSISKISTDNYLSGELKKREIGSTWSTEEGDLYFKVDVPDFIDIVFPREQLSEFSYPKIAISIVSRPRVIRKWIDWRIAEYHLTSAIVIYSRYEDELDKLVSLVDRVLFKEQTKLKNIQIVTPSNFTDIVPIENKFSRAINFDLQYKMYEI